MANPQELQSRYEILLLTGELPSHMRVEAVYGLVHGTSVRGANFIKDFFARVADVTGGRVGGYETAVRGAIDLALEEMAKKASKLGANAVTDVRVITSSVNGSILMATVSGTAVYAQDAQDVTSDKGGAEVPSKSAAPEPIKYLHEGRLG